MDLIHLLIMLWLLFSLLVLVPPLKNNSGGINRGKNNKNRGGNNGRNQNNRGNGGNHNSRGSDNTTNTNANRRRQNGMSQYSNFSSYSMSCIDSFTNDLSSAGTTSSSSNFQYLWSVFVSRSSSCLSSSKIQFQICSFVLGKCHLSLNCTV